VAEALTCRDLVDVAMQGHFCGCGSNFLLLALRIADSSRINRSAAAALFLDGE
jgi:hypothetical protein